MKSHAEKFSDALMTIGLDKMKAIRYMSDVMVATEIIEEGTIVFFSDFSLTILRNDHKIEVIQSESLTDLICHIYPFDNIEGATTKRIHCADLHEGVQV